MVYVKGRYNPEHCAWAGFYLFSGLTDKSDKFHDYAAHNITYFIVSITILRIFNSRKTALRILS